MSVDYYADFVGVEEGRAFLVDLVVCCDEWRSKNWECCVAFGFC